MPARPRKTRTIEGRAVPVRTGKASAADVATYLGRSEQTLANWRWQGKGPKCTGKGRGVMYDWADVDEWLESLPTSGAAARRGAA